MLESERKKEAAANLRLLLNALNQQHRLLSADEMEDVFKLLGVAEMPSAESEGFE